MQTFLRRVSFSILVLWCGALTADQSLESELRADFSAKLALLVQEMNQQRVKPLHEKDIRVIHRLAKKEIVELWDAKSTLLGLIGRSSWNQLTAEHQSQLEHAFRETMTRYFMEAYAYYSGQPIEIKAIKLNKKRTKGWLQLEVKLDYLPDFQVDVGITRRENQWLYRDIRVQGISYISLKRQYFQGTIANQGVEGLIADLVEKNRNFFAQFPKLAAKG